MDNQVLWISHRGLRESCVENTLEAFRAAVDAGFNCLETDIRVSRDDRLILHHDLDMRATAGCDLRITELLCEEFCNTRLIDDQCGLDFETFVEHFREYHWILDIKPEQGARALQLLKKWAVGQGHEALLLARTRFLLWRREHEQLLQRLFPGAVTVANEQECRRAGLASLLRLPMLGGIRPGRTYSLPPRFAGQSLYHRPIIEAYQRRGARVLAFLPEHPAEVDRALRAGVDELLVDSCPPQMSDTWR